MLLPFKSSIFEKVMMEGRNFFGAFYHLTFEMKSCNFQENLQV